MFTLQDKFEMFCLFMLNGFIVFGMVELAGRRIVRYYFAQQGLAIKKLDDDLKEAVAPSGFLQKFRN